jgi:hypothetical protein
VWHWDRFLPEYFGFPLSVSFHLCFIRVEKQRKHFIVIIVPIGFRKKPSSCGASVVSSAGPFNVKKRKKRLG